MAEKKIQASKHPEENRGKARKPDKHGKGRQEASAADDAGSVLARLQHQAGNRAVQRLLAQRTGNGPAELEDETAGRINRERSSGQPMDEGAREHLEGAMGQDFSGVRVHTSPEADMLSQDLGARAFTTGQDIFFREGEYQPGSSSGRELLAHEAAHVVQQGAGAMGSVGRMTVNAPGDAFEQEAEAVAKSVTSAGQAPGAAAGVQLQEEEKEEVQMAAEEEEKEEIQRAPEEEEEQVQMQEMDEEEEVK
jgi:hypothetical protein